MPVHKIAINNRIASIGADAELICNNPTDTIRFEFDDEWSVHTTKTARFSWEGKYIDVVFSGNEVKTPEIYRTNYVFVGVYADNITTTPVKIRCKYSIKCMGGAVAAPAPDVYTQLIELINGINCGGNGGGVVEESDPTVPDWAKAATKPTYTATEVGAIADETSVIKTKHYSDMSITSTKLADDAIWPRHISDLTWNEVDSRINAAIEESGDESVGAGVVYAALNLSDNTWSCDMTYDEILAVINTGKQVILKRQTSNDVTVNYVCIGLFGQTNNPNVVFHYHNQNTYSLAYIFQTGKVSHYNGTLVKANQTINGHSLTDNVVLTAADVGALPDSDATWTEIDSRINAALGVIENGSY